MALFLIARKWRKFQTEVRQRVALRDASRGGGDDAELELELELGVERAATMCGSQSVVDFFWQLF